jgi:4-amino-4-deoxy-L-arabinose transferase-like glycosyltransferase
MADEPTKPDEPEAAEAEAEDADGAEAPHEPEPEIDEPVPPERLLPPGNPIRWRGIVPIGAGACLALAAMASEASARVVVPLAVVGVALALGGTLDLLGTFDDGDSRVAASVKLEQLASPLGGLAFGLSAMFILLRLAVAGRLPVLATALGMPVAFLATVVSVYGLGARLGPWRVDENGLPRSLLRRHGFWLVCVATLVYLPMLGNHSLIDPWETHYGEVSREILARNDWISLWWAQEAWFWSKPVLTFWIQAIPMALLGVRYEAGGMLAAAGRGLSPQPEWAVRMPIFLLAVGAHYLLYKAVARSHGRRAGLLGSLVLLTMPQWFLLAQQTMTDMPFVACLGGAVALFLLAVQTKPDEQVRVYEVALGRLRLRLSLYHLVLGAVLAVALPQILYLFSRNLTLLLSPAPRLLFHADRYMSGSAGNCGLPGNEACRYGLKPVVSGLQPVIQGLIWLQALALVLWLSWGERRRQRLLFLAMWLLVALSTMAKGVAGLGLPALIAVWYVLATRRWRDLARMELLAGVLIFAGAVLPWFVAMYVRHGQPFTDRLLFHDMFKRAFEHVHDTNQGDDTSFRYYVWQLGYATFPWTGLVPIALVRWLRERRPIDHPRSVVGLVMLGWFTLGFALFALMLTKFHHYCLPLVPAAAMLTGVLLDDFMRSAERPARAPSIGDLTAAFDRRAERALLGATAIGGALLTLVAGIDLAWQRKGGLAQIRLVHLFSYNYGRPWPDSLDFRAALWAFVGAATLLTAALVVVRLRPLVVTAMLAMATCFGLWGLDVYFVKIAPHWGQRELYLRYEREKRDVPGPIVAYQLNWKGENFYRSNDIAAFVSSGDKFKKWVEEQRRNGVKVLYFVTEHGRTSGLSGEVGTAAKLELLTTKSLNNKFVLVRVRLG